MTARIRSMGIGAAIAALLAAGALLFPAAPVQSAAGAYSSCTNALKLATQMFGEGRISSGNSYMNSYKSRKWGC